MRPLVTLLAFSLAACGGPTDEQGRPLPIQTEYTEPFYRNDPELGVSAEPSRRVKVRKSYGGETVYAATYSSDACGLRASPPPPPGPARPVLFFGDSFTFGEGVDDDETFPAVFQTETGGRYRALNLGLPGYGPHHMLRQLETGREACALAGRKPVLAVYVAGNNHPARAAGRAPWDASGPRYALDAEGKPRFMGAFQGPLAATLTNARRLALPRPGDRAWEDPVAEDEARFAAILEASSRLLRRRYGARLVVVLLEERLPEAALRARGLSVIAPGELLPPGFLLSHRFRYDGHPNAAFHESLGRSLARRLGDDS